MAWPSAACHSDSAKVYVEITMKAAKATCSTQGVSEAQVSDFTGELPSPNLHPGPAQPPMAKENEATTAEQHARESIRIARTTRTRAA